MSEENVKLIITSIGTITTWLFGSWDIAIIVFLCFIVLDFVTGLIKACANKNLSSRLCRIGIGKKAMMLLMVIVGVLLDRLLSQNGSWVFRTLICYFYIANEGISILENCCELGLPIPQKIKDVLVQLRDKEQEI